MIVHYCIASEVTDDVVVGDFPEPKPKGEMAKW